MDVDKPDLSALLAKARALSSQALTDGALPSVALGIEQVESQSRALAARAQQKQEAIVQQRGAASARAQYLLASAHVNTDAINETLDKLDPSTAFVPLQPLRENDLEGLVRHAHESTIISAIEDNRRQIVADFYRSLSEDLHASWEKQKQSIFDELSKFRGRAAGSQADSRRDLDGMGAESSSRGAQDPPAAIPAGQRDRASRYEHAVHGLNDARLSGGPFDAAGAFGAAVRGPGNDSKPSRLLSAWHLLSLLVGGGSAGSTAPLPMHAYARAYHAADDSKEAVDTRKDLARGALKYLEEHFLTNVLDRELAEKAQQAQIGGVPSISRKVEAYVRLQGGRDRWPTVEVFTVETREEPLWANIFFLLRSGNGQQAVEYARTHESKLRTASPDFVACFARWQSSADRQLPRAEQDLMSSYYVAYLHHASSVDPFKLALHKILARAELGKKRIAAVTERTEDWLWLQLALSREGDASAAGERWGLLDIGKDVVRYDAATFGSAYFHVLLLSAQYERAIAHLYSRPQQQIDAVHLAIALAYYGLLRLPQNALGNEVDLLTLESDGRVALDFNRLLHRHLRSFSQAAPAEALQYICLVTMAAGGSTVSQTEQSRVAQSYVSALVQESRAYSVLLGGLDGTGMKQPGRLDAYGPLLCGPGENTSTYLRKLIRDVARHAEADKGFATAIELYNLADEPDSVMRVLNAELGRVLFRPAESANAASSQGMLQDIAQQDPFAAAKALLEYYSRNRGVQRRPAATLSVACERLLQLRHAVTSSRDNHLAEALESIRGTDLLPLSTPDVSAIMRKAEETKELDEALSRNLGEIILLAMNVLYQLHQQLGESAWTDAGRQAKIDSYRSAARSLMTYAGMLRLRLPTGVFEQLARCSAFMN